MDGFGISIEGLSKRYGEGDTAVDALKDVNMTVAPGEVVGLIGPSGSGKSTLLKCLGAVIEPTTGKMTLGDEVIYDNGWKIPDLRALRRDRIGFVFQAPYLIPFLDVIDNVALLPMLAGRPNGESRKRALELLEALDVGHRAKAQPSQLSGGEQQRVAIARALANSRPKQKQGQQRVCQKVNPPGRENDDAIPLNRIHIVENCVVLRQEHITSNEGGRQI